MSSRKPFRTPAVVPTALVTLILGVLGIAPAQAVPVGSSPTTWTVLVGEQSPDMAIQGMAFLPDDITVNSGDSINFVANSAEIHTVSYGQPPIFPITGVNDLLTDAVPPAGPTAFDPHVWTNSGILTTKPSSDFPSRTSYRLTFDTVGNYTFYCLIHGTMMSATVHVQKTGTAYPHPKQYYVAQGIALSARVIADGYQLWRKTPAQSSPTHVFVGAMDDQAMVMRFIPSIDTVPVGTTVTFDMGANMGLVPHTVTFPDHLSSSSPVLLGNATFPVTFDQVGTWNYFCAFHDDLGMVGSVIVTP